MFPRHEMQMLYKRYPVKINCPEPYEPRVVVYQTGYRNILAGILILLGLISFGPELYAKADIFIPTESLGSPIPEQVQIQDRQTADLESAPERKYARHVESASTEHKIDPKLIHAVIDVESEGNPRAVSPRGAKGLMQLMPVVCREYGVRDPFNMEQNINAGSAHLAYLLDVLNGDLERALAAYNCGLGRVKGHSRIPPLEETRKFVRKTIAKYRSNS